MFTIGNFTIPNYHKTPEKKLLYLAELRKDPQTSLWLLEQMDWMDDHLWIPSLATVLYLLLISLGPRLMKERKPFTLKYPLVLWNFALALFSLYGTLRTWPPFIEAWSTQGFFKEICHIDLDISIRVGEMVYFFVWSKIPEFFDTAFIVLRKKPLRFLQYYHHITTMWFCWLACSRHLEMGSAFAMLNLFVHSVMYTYFGCAALDIRWPSFLRLSITVLQVAQMIIGTIFVVISFLSCYNDPLILWMALIMYISYFILFANLLYENCCGTPQHSKTD